MYGYPEQFIPIPELVGYGAAPHVATPATAGAAPTPTTQEVTA
jgi:Amt family ammonium transporter